MMGGGGSKDDSSISDSESVSESSSKGQEQKSSSLKESDGSPKKVISNQEDKAIEEDIASSTNSLDLLEVSDTPTLISSLGGKSSHTKLKHFQGLRRRKVPKASSNPSSPTSIKMSLLADSHKELEELDVEPGVEAYEDSDLVTPLDTNLDYDIPTTDYRTSPPSSNDVVSTLSRPRHRSFFLRYKVFQKLLILVALLATYFLFQLPTYLSGFLCGVLMTVASYTLFLRLFDILKPSPSMLVDVDVASERFAVPDYSKMPILEIPAVKEYQPINKHAGWMNEYPFNYEPGRYSLTDTRSVYVRLEGSTMRISQTRAKIPKRAMFNEREHNKVKFHHQRIYDISQCQVTLLPEGLTRKRLWSKKYPICIMFGKNCVYKVEYIKEDSTQDIPNSTQDIQDSSSDKGGLVELPDPEVRFQESEDTLHDSADEFHDVTDGEEGDIDDDDEDDDTFCHIDKTALEETCIYLFSRTDREKEEWYRKLVAAVKDRIPAPPNPFNDSSLPCPASTFPRPDEQPMVSTGVSIPERETVDQRYLQFMTRFHLKVHRYTGQRLTKACQTLLLPRSLHDIANHQESSEHLHTTHSSTSGAQPQPKLANMFAYLRQQSVVDIIASKQPTVVEATTNSQTVLRPSSRRLVKMESEIKLEMEHRDVDCDVMWVNVLIGRVLFDILSNPQCVELIRDKIQKKLSTIKSVQKVHHKYCKQIKYHYTPTLNWSSHRLETVHDHVNGIGDSHASHRLETVHDLVNGIGDSHASHRLETVHDHVNGIGDSHASHRLETVHDIVNGIGDSHASHRLETVNDLVNGIGDSHASHRLETVHDHVNGIGDSHASHRLETVHDLVNGIGDSHASHRLETVHDLVNGIGDSHASHRLETVHDLVNGIGDSHASHRLETVHDHVNGIGDSHASHRLETVHDLVNGIGDSHASHRLETVHDLVNGIGDSHASHRLETVHDHVNGIGDSHASHRLETVHDFLPYFVEELLVTDLELGDAVPMIHRVSSPLLDERGLWVDLDVTYEGSVCLTLETKLNLMKLKEEAAKVVKDEKRPGRYSRVLVRNGRRRQLHPRGSVSIAPAQVSNIALGCVGQERQNTLWGVQRFKTLLRTVSVTLAMDWTVQDREIEARIPVRDDSPKRKPAGGTSKKIINMVSKIAASKYFQHATENKYIKRAMEGVSNTKIVLGVELKGLVGTLAINISPPPSDRLWYGFRTNPRIWLSARPKLGERQVNIGHLVSWIEKKLIAEFQKKFVYPNMDDLVIPPMSSELPK
ncbi:unnamed protein product [Timema podura]|uniref:SMP-LTD domain-containing protein n=1 Tax=Timema podura TaxID=61482 RepID=A0ABN7NTP0_TIMPD|nr:unnamed protein product [Timema podura]